MRDGSCVHNWIFLPFLEYKEHEIMKFNAVFQVKVAWWAINKQPIFFCRQIERIWNRIETTISEWKKNEKMEKYYSNIFFIFSNNMNRKEEEEDGKFSFKSSSFLGELCEPLKSYALLRPFMIWIEFWVCWMGENNDNHNRNHKTCSLALNSHFCTLFQ